MKLCLEWNGVNTYRTLYPNYTQSNLDCWCPGWKWYRICQGDGHSVFYRLMGGAAMHKVCRVHWECVIELMVCCYHQKCTGVHCTPELKSSVLCTLSCSMPLKVGVLCPLVILQKVCIAHHYTSRLCFEHFPPMVCCEAGVLVPLTGVLSPLQF